MTPLYSAMILKAIKSTLETDKFWFLSLEFYLGPVGNQLFIDRSPIELF